MHPQLTRLSRLFLRLLLPVVYVLLTLLLASCSFLDSGSSTHNSTPNTSTTRNMTPTTVDQTASETSSPTSAPTHVGTTQTTTTALAPVPFKVTGVAFGAWPGDHQGVCRTNTFFTASVIIYAPANTSGGTVTYAWQRSDTSTITPSSITFAAGTTSRIVTSFWSLSANQDNGSA